MTIELCSPLLNRSGFVYDFNEIKSVKGWIDETLDHRHLNDVMPRPTSEELARFIHDKAKKILGRDVVAVRVSETPNTWAEYRP